MAFEKSKWIWLAQEESIDQYAEFFDTAVYEGEKTEIRISVTSDYALFVNDRYVSSNQYGDYEHYKIYDTVDLTPFLSNGENKIKILAYYCGAETSRHSNAKAGLIYEVISGERILTYSCENTPSRLCPTYESGFRVLVSGQLGFTFSYDATKEKDNSACKNSRVVVKNCSFFPRPIKKQSIGKRCDVKYLAPQNEAKILVDLGGEVVGLPTFEIYSDTEQTLTFAWGEHIADGRVRKEIDGRHFFFKYKAKKGKNLFTEYMLRIACRYIEVYAENPIDVSYIGILPETYEVSLIEKKIKGKKESEIYGICVNTLRLCMMEHYVDCPWREQALYAFDSRNQMLCGYYAFENQNRDYARANLLLIGKDRRDDGLLSICYPCTTKLAIPSFSLHYITAVKEYIEATKDETLGEEVFEKISEIISVFASRIKDGLICRFGGEWLWNFYDWSEFCEGTLFHAQEKIPDLIINCLFIIALENFEYICNTLGKDFEYKNLKDTLTFGIRKVFLDKNGLFSMHEGKREYTVLGNALAVLAEVADGENAEFICEKIVTSALSECSLSMKIFQYEALMKINAEKYKDFILNDIRKNYGAMLDFGSTTVWETQDGINYGGEGRAGSLCHGWSAVPVYIYHKLGVIES